MGKPRVPIDPVADLRRRLARSDRARVRSCVLAWWADHGFAETPAAVGKRVALALIEQPPTETKLAGILIFQELLDLRAADLAAFGRLFSHGHLADASVVDWFAVKVLATLLDRTHGRAEAVRTIAHWRNADTAWQRRAACLAFTRLAADGGDIAETIVTVCATVVWSHERVDQTAVGALLRELSRAEPARVETFFRKHALLMSKECARAATAKFPPERRKDLLAHHKRATSLRT
jgi:DNA alkylation repair enzyme